MKHIPRVTLSGAKRNRTPKGRGVASGSTRGFYSKMLVDPFDARFALAQGDTKKGNTKNIIY